MKLFKIDKGTEIVEIIKKIKTLKEDEVAFEVPKGAVIAKTAHNFVLIKKTAEVTGKTVMIKTSDPSIKALTAKAGLLLDDDSDSFTPPARRPASSARRTTRVSDIGGTRPAPAATKLAPAKSGSLPVRLVPTMPKFRLPRPGSASAVFVLVIVVLIVAVFALAVLLPRADITVYARSENIVRDLEIGVDRSATSINSSRLIVPGQPVNKEVSHTRTFETTGVKLTGTKATGSITMYNFTTNTLTLRAATTTLLIDGKKYYFARDVTGLRPTGRIGSGSEQQIDQTTLIPPVPIIAGEVGADYNISSGQRLEVVNAALGRADVYAVTNTNIAGGAATESKVLSQADIDKATELMTQDLAEIAERELNALGQDSLRVLPSAVTTEVQAKTANKNVDDEVAAFDMTMIARLSGLAFSDNDIRSLVLEKIDSVLSEDKYLLEDGQQALRTSFKNLDLAAGKGTLAVHFETQAAYRINGDDMAETLAGKNMIEIKEMFMTKPEVDKVEVRFSPFFVNKAPRFNGKIFIKTVLSPIGSAGP